MKGTHLKDRYSGAKICRISWTGNGGGESGISLGDFWVPVLMLEDGLWIHSLKLQN